MADCSSQAPVASSVLAVVVVGTSSEEGEAHFDQLYNTPDESMIVVSVEGRMVARVQEMYSLNSVN